MPEDLSATLRTYQSQGVAWLAFLRRAGLGALLADDMGLGRTLHALCALEGLSLVVAPTSVVHNWAAETARFRPSLRATGLAHRGENLRSGTEFFALRNLSTEGRTALAPPLCRAEQRHTDRTRVLDAAHTLHPERFVHGVPTPPPLPTAAWINKPKSEDGSVIARA